MPVPQHNEFKNALVKDGWVITDDPFTLEYKGLCLQHLAIKWGTK